MKKLKRKKKGVFERNTRKISIDKKEYDGICKTLKNSKGD